MRAARMVALDKSEIAIAPSSIGVNNNNISNNKYQ
jgi:hypothetical protein